MSVENGYAECYPGLVEMEDAIGDSDEETDYRQEFPPESTRVGGGGAGSETLCFGSGSYFDPD